MQNFWKMAHKSATSAISKIVFERFCGLSCPVSVPNWVRIGCEMAELGDFFDFAWAPMETMYKKNDKKSPETESDILTPPQRVVCTDFRPTELGGDDGLYGRQTGKVADRPPLMIVKSRRRRDQLKLISVHKLRSSDGENFDTSGMC